MLRVPLNKSYIKRTIRPLYAFSQATPKSQFVDPAWDLSVDIYPGMCLMKTVGENVTLLNAAGNPYGLSAFYMAPAYGIDEITEQGVNACAVWVMSPDAEFDILAPAFDTGASWVEPTTGAINLVSAYTEAAGAALRGKLCPAGTANAHPTAIARLIKVISSTKITVGGLQGTHA